MTPDQYFERLTAGIRALFIDPRHKKRIVYGSAAALGLAAFGAIAVVPASPDADPSSIPVKILTEELPIPQLAQQIEQLEQSDTRYVQEISVRYGDTLANMLGRLGVDDAAALAFVRRDAVAQRFVKLKAGQVVQATIDDAGQLQHLQALLPSDSGKAGKGGWQTLAVTRTADGFAANLAPAQIETRTEMASGTINSSLFAATDAARIPDSVASQMVDMFSTDIDFASDLRRGDRFNIVYQTYWQNGQYVGAGRILAGDFVNTGKRYQSVWFDGNGVGYYTFDGRSLKKSFLRSPLRYTRISSGFTLRKHPILGVWKQHKGVDFAAVTGTPIHATADGTVAFVGKQNGYGNIVVLKNWGVYSTAYAHMSRFASGLKRGQKITQGEVIGYVGQTGWATGPHLHYELRVNNVATNPLTAVAKIGAQPLNARELGAFKLASADLRRRIEVLDASASLNGTALATNR